MEKQWLDEMIDQYNHPSVILWRAIELRTIASTLKMKNIHLKHPILDLGCGEGKIAESLFGKQVIDYGLDNYEDVVKSAIKSGVYKQVVLGDACKLPFKENIFQTIFSNCVIEHISDLDSVLSEVSRVLKKGGFLIFTVPTSNFRRNLSMYRIFQKLGLKFLAEKYSNYRNKQLNHFNCFGFEDWQKILQKKGLVVKSHQFYMTPKTSFYWDLLALVYFPSSKISFYPFKTLLAKLVLKKLYKEAENDEATQPYGRGIFSLLHRWERNPSRRRHSLWRRTAETPLSGAEGDKTSSSILLIARKTDIV